MASATEFPVYLLFMTHEDPYVATLRVYTRTQVFVNIFLYEVGEVHIALSWKGARRYGIIEP